MIYSSIEIDTLNVRAQYNSIKLCIFVSSWFIIVYTLAGIWWGTMRTWNMGCGELLVLSDTCVCANYATVGHCNKMG